MNDIMLRWLALFIINSIFSVWILHRQYRLLGKLNWFGTLMHIAVYAIHAMFCGMLAWGNLYAAPPMGSAAGLGVALMIIGFSGTIIAMDLLRAFSRWLGIYTPGLKTDGLYRWSRNPQFITYGLLLLGFFINWWNSLAWLGIFSYIGLVFAIVRIEEEHLERVYGADYVEYCARVPRFFGLPKR